MHLSTAQLGVSSQKWVYQDVSAVGMGRRPRRGEKAREGGGEARSTNSFIPCFLPSASASFFLGFAGPLPPPPLCYHSKAMLTAGVLAPVSWEVSVTSPKPALPAWFSPFPAPGCTPQNATYPAGSSTWQAVLGDLALARPKGCSKIQNPG